MGRFVNKYLPVKLPLNPEDWNDDFPWEVTRSIIYLTDVKGGPERIKVPRGFPTDFASIPQWVLHIVPNNHEVAAAAVVHDYLHRNNIGTRKYQDRVFKEILKHTCPRKYRIVLMYWGVRLNSTWLTVKSWFRK